MRRMYMFKLENVTYKDVLDIPELSISAGAITCIIGKSGSGKTTLVKLLNGLISPTEGTIYVENEDIKEMSMVQLRRRVSMLQQSPSIYEGTLRENLQIGRFFSELEPASDDEILDVLEVVNLDKDLDQDASKLSGGEKQRLTLARMLLLPADVLILDEPTASLDEESAHTIMSRVLQHCIDENKSVIMITHADEIVKSFAEHLIELKDGKVSRDERVEPTWTQK